eukprot:tig00000760_g3938.t1
MAAPAAAGGSPLDLLPDELLSRVLFEAARRDWTERPVCAGTSLLDPGDDEPDVQPEELVKLKAVCRRFRRVIDDGSLWGRVALWEPNDVDAALDALTKLPEKARASIQRVVLNAANTSITSTGLCKLAAALRDQIEEFSIFFTEANSDADHDRFPFVGIVPIITMQRLRSLCFGVCEHPSAFVSAFTTPSVRESICMSFISFLPDLQVREP